MLLELRGPSWCDRHVSTAVDNCYMLSTELSLLDYFPNIVLRMVVRTKPAGHAALLAEYLVYQIPHCMSCNNSNQCSLTLARPAH